VLALAARCGLPALVADRVRIAAKGGANAAAKIMSLVAGMVAGADCIDDMDLLRHGGMNRLCTDVRAPSTLGTFLRLFTFGHVRQLDAVATGLLTRLAAATPILAGAEAVAFVDLDDTVRATYGYAKQGAGRGYTGVNGVIPSRDFDVGGVGQVLRQEPPVTHIDDRITRSADDQHRNLDVG
jgi:hypothetical protein